MQVNLLWRENETKKDKLIKWWVIEATAVGIRGWVPPGLLWNMEFHLNSTRLELLSTDSSHHWVGGFPRALSPSYFQAVIAQGQESFFYIGEDLG